jgi:DNA sulfur modification protein DndB
MIGSLYLPALQGRFGSWLYYATIMKLSDVRDRVKYATEIHNNTTLNDIIQRRLDDPGRSNDIAEYLIQTRDRFFNSLVVGVYGGNPQWHPFDIKARNRAHAVASLAEQEIVGYLELSGGERLFALDGQHRLAGIKRALQRKTALGQERVSVLFVAHEDSAAGLRRTRSLFVAINKKAVAVQKRDIIVLDEVDWGALLTRQLVDTHPWFSRGQVDVERFTPSIPAGAPALTTIGNFYDVIRAALRDVMAPNDREELRRGDRIRLSDARMNHYRQLVVDYFEVLAGLDPTLRTALAAQDFAPLVIGARTRENPRLLFRPIGLTLMTRVLGQLRKTRTLSQSLRLARSIPVLMSQPPLAEILWDPVRNRMITRNVSLCVNLTLYMLGARTSDARLRQSYAAWRGEPVANVRLPARIVR